MKLISGKCLKEKSKFGYWKESCRNTFFNGTTQFSIPEFILFFFWAQIIKNEIVSIPVCNKIQRGKKECKKIQFRFWIDYQNKQNGNAMAM